MSAEPGSARIRPYEHLSDSELHSLTDEAAVLALRIANADPLQVVAVLTEAGCPRPDATAMITNPMLRQGAFRFYFDTLDARLGDREAGRRVEYVKESWLRMRRGRVMAGKDAV